MGESKVLLKPRDKTTGPQPPHWEARLATEAASSTASRLSSYGMAPLALGVHHKTVIGSSNDPAELDADRVADRIEDSHSGNPVSDRAGPPATSEGSQLQDPTRSFFEQQLGHDLGQVRVHTDTHAAASARALNARAYTVGQDVVFGAGQYAPATTAGQWLLAHELTHVAQQGYGLGLTLRRKLVAPPTRLNTDWAPEMSFPSGDEKSLDANIRRFQQMEIGAGKHKAKLLGTVEYVGVPDLPNEGAPSKAVDLERRAVRGALVQVLDTANKEPELWVDTELRVRVPLDLLAQSDYAMVVLRFDRERNVEVQFTGRDVQQKGAALNAGTVLGSITREYGINFVEDEITAKVGDQKKSTTYAGKAWSNEDALLIERALPLLSETDRTIIKGSKFRRLALARLGDIAGFYSPADDSVNLMDAALPFEKDVWFGEGRKFYSRGVHTVLHEIGHALHFAEIPKKGTSVPIKNLQVPASKEMLVRFKTEVLAESKRRTGKAAKDELPPAKIQLPTTYSKERWMDFFADTYAIYRTNPSFLSENKEHKYLYDFFKQYYG